MLGADNSRDSLYLLVSEPFPGYNSMMSGMQNMVTRLQNMGTNLARQGQEFGERMTRRGQELADRLAAQGSLVKAVFIYLIKSFVLFLSITLWFLRLEPGHWNSACHECLIRGTGQDRHSYVVKA